MSGRHPWALAALGAEYDRAGERAGAEAVYAELVARAQREYVQPWTLTVAAMSTGRMDEAVALCQRGLDERDPFILGAFVEAFQDGRRLRADPRYPELRARAGWDVATRE
jgi:hypothetical protein